MNEPTSLEFALKHFGMHPQKMTQSMYQDYLHALTWAPISEGGYGYSWQSTADVAARYAPIIKSAGMWTPKYTDYEVFMLATAIMRDEEVSKRGPDALLVVRSMTAAELDAVVGRIKNKYSKTSIKKG